MKDERNAEALALLQRALEQCEVAHRMRPTDALTSRFLTIQLNNVATKAKREGESDVTLNAHRRRVEVLDRRARDNPTIPGFETELVTGYVFLLNELRDAGRLEEAAKTADQARVRLAEMTEESTTFFAQVVNFHLTVHTIAATRAKADANAKVNTEEEAATVVRAMRDYVLAGWHGGANWLRTDPRTEPLRQRPDVKDLLNHHSTGRAINASASRSSSSRCRKWCQLER